jgi:hypothetical protein
MAQIPFDHTEGSTLTLPGLRAWLHEKLAAKTRQRRGDAPTRHTDAEIRDLYCRNRGHKPVATDAMTQNALRAGLWGRY